MLPKHHRQKWPEKPGNRDASPLSQKQRHQFIKGEAVSVSVWAKRCMDGVWRALIATNPLKET